MSESIPFNPHDAHKFFSAHCFNAVWGLLDKSDRTSQEREQMILLAQASFWHWTQRSDVTDQNRSIGYWLLSRVYAVVGEWDNARKYGLRCLEVTPTDQPFLLGYAHEALARAELLAGHTEQGQAFWAEASRLCEQIADAADRQYLENDLKTLR